MTTIVTSKLRKIMCAFKSLTDILDLKKVREVYRTLIEYIVIYGISI